MKKLYSEFKEGKSPTFWVLVILISGIFLIFFPYIFTTYSSFLNLNYGTTGEIGDIISGVTMPFISFAGIILTFLAFWIQYKANLELRRDIEIERFNNRFYELLNLHKQNVNEMDLGGEYIGREVFIALHNELKYTYWIIENELNDMKSKDDPARRQPEFIIDIAYRVFYEGLDQVSFDNLKNYLDTKCETDEFYGLVKKLDGESKRIGKPIENFNNPHIGDVKVNHLQTRFSFRHPLFRGQISKLGHYYRHLYLTVKYIDGIEEDKLNADEKYEFVKTIRGQLSVYEQAMLYYNAMSESGKPWLKEENPLLIKYRLIKNIRKSHTDFGPNPWVKFKAEITDYQTRKKRFFEN